MWAARRGGARPGKTGRGTQARAGGEHGRARPAVAHTHVRLDKRGWARSIQRNLSGWEGFKLSKGT